jgi:hypothetical protein
MCPFLVFSLQSLASKTPYTFRSGVQSPSTMSLCCICRTAYIVSHNVIISCIETLNFVWNTICHMTLQLSGMVSTLWTWVKVCFVSLKPNRLYKSHATLHVIWDTCWRKVSSPGTVARGNVYKFWYSPMHVLTCPIKINEHIRGCNQKFLDWPPGVRTANGTALCH